MFAVEAIDRVFDSLVSIFDEFAQLVTSLFVFIFESGDSRGNQTSARIHDPSTCDVVRFDKIQ